jgi:hypothetical protein
MGDAALVDAVTVGGMPTDKNAADPIIKAMIKPDEKSKPAVSAETKDETLEVSEGEGPQGEEEHEETPEDDLFDEEDGETGEGDDEEVDTDLDVVVTVDGEQKTVKLSQLQQNYSLGAATEKRLQQATELRNGYYQVGEQLYNNLQAQSERLQGIDNVLKEIAEPTMDWEKLRITDPQRYLIEKEKTREAQDKRNQLSQEQQRVQQEQARLQELRHRVEVQAETGKFLEAMPALRDPTVAKAFQEATFDIGTKVYGLAPEEINAVSKSSHMLVLADAIRYRLLLQRRAQKAGKGDKANGKGEPIVAAGSVKPLMRPGANKQFSSRMAEARDAKAIRARAQATGDVDDVAKMLIVKRAK